MRRWRRGIVCRSFGSSINRQAARMRADAVLELGFEESRGGVEERIEEIGCCGMFLDFVAAVSKTVRGTAGQPTRLLSDISRGNSLLSPLDGRYEPE